MGCGFLGGFFGEEVNLIWTQGLLKMGLWEGGFWEESYLPTVLDCCFLNSTIAWACTSVAACCLKEDVLMLIMPSTKAGWYIVISHRNQLIVKPRADGTLKWKHLVVIGPFKFSQTDVLKTLLFSPTHFSAVLTCIACPFTGGSSVDEALLVCFHADIVSS